MQLIILAAGMGSRLAPLTDDRPKCLVPVAGRPLLEWQLDAARNAGFDDIVVVGGYRHDQLASYPVTLEINDRFATTNMVETLMMARRHFGDGFVMSYGDIAFSPAVLRQAREQQAPIGVVIDLEWRRYWEARFDDPLADAETLRVTDDGRITEIGNRPESLDEIQGQYIGLVAFRGDGVEALTATYDAARAETASGRRPFNGARALEQLYMTDLLQGLICAGQVLRAIPIRGGWIEVDSPSDRVVAERLIEDGRFAGSAN